MREKGRRVAPSLRIFVLLSVGCLLTFVFAALPAAAAATIPVKVGGVFAGDPLAHDGVVWFNGFDPAPLVIHVGDTVQWKLIGGIHTVTSTQALNATTWAYDSSPLFPVEATLGDLSPGRLLPPGSVYENDTSFLAPGTYVYFCKIHPGMTGTLVVTSGLVIDQVVNVVAGWGDPNYAVQAFAPQNISVPQGTIVRWTLMNPTEPHTITSAVWDSSPALPPGLPPVMVAPGSTFNWTFTSEGTFTYFCKLHAYKIGESWIGMTGTIIVLPAPADTGALAAVGYGGLAFGILALVVAGVSLMRRKGPTPPSP